MRNASSAFNFDLKIIFSFLSSPSAPQSTANSVEKMDGRFDIVIYGASGFTGAQVVRYLGEVCRKEGCEVTWAVAGRSTTKLSDILAEVGRDLGETLDVPVIKADSFDEASLREMARRARLVINCTGPYRDFGPPVVRACIAEGAHYVDVTAESLFPEKIQLECNESAKKAGVYVVTSCGFDSIPVDIGVQFLIKNFPGTLNSVETYHDVSPEGGQSKFSPGPAINVGTWQSLVSVLEDIKHLDKVRSKLFKKDLPKLRPTLSTRFWPHRPPTGNGWGLFFPNTDAAVVRRSQRHLHETTNSRPIQIRTYLVSQKFWYIAILLVGASTWLLWSRFKCGVRLLRRHPKFFTMGFMSPNPTPEGADNIIFNVWLKGCGWKGRKVDAGFEGPTDATILGRCKGRNGYRATAVCVIVSALTVLFEKDKLPQNGGVFTSAAAFGGTGIVDRLGRNEVIFEIVEGAA